MNTRFKLLVICPTMTDATSFYRGVMPLAVLEKQIPDLQLVFVNEVNWATIAMVDAVFLQRPSTDGHLEIAKVCNNWGKPLWVDYDDDLFGVPDDNPTFAYYSSKNVQRNVAETVLRSDIVSVSTNALFDRLNDGPAKGKPITVVPNAWATKRLPERLPAERNKLVMWRGSKTHSRDVASVIHEILELAHNNLDWTWHFIGAEMDQFFWLYDQMPEKRCVFSPAMDVVEYLKLTQLLAPSIFISPLVDTPFNRAKSNIAWMEGVYAGAVHVAPGIPEFANRPGCRVYYDGDSFKAQMQDLMQSSDEKLTAESNIGWGYIQENLDLEKVNERRIAIIDFLKEKAQKK